MERLVSLLRQAYIVRNFLCDFHMECIRTVEAKPLLRFTRLAHLSVASDEVESFRVAVIIVGYNRWARGLTARVQV